MACAVDFSKKSIFLVSGASQGIGREISIKFAQNVNKNSIFILLARSLEGLEETKKRISKIDNGLTVLTHAIDLSKPNLEKYNQLFDQVLKTIDSTGIEYGYIFHNAASNGEMKRISELSNIQTWREYYEFNLFSAVLLNNAFLEKFSPVAQKLVVVEISSACAIVPYPHLVLHGTSKAARQNFFKVLAAEQLNIIVLIYCPGAVRTEMFDLMCKTAEPIEVRRAFQEITDKNILTTDQTIGRLVEILRKGDFKSGDIVDYHNHFGSINSFK
ncbi:sepiapterin reductase-like [Sitophilus oryzae]|uniref:Sepiapterin reductase-like n=1 Tax=Sitophilus oryzae TaxID=7048 RepID=A0A6J2YXM1_SITOR|nr:sepiapterin reductase-like [Sitophilus oryzae]